jgi:hypothetical protein
VTSLRCSLLSFAPPAFAGFAVIAGRAEWRCLLTLPWLAQRSFPHVHASVTYATRASSKTTNMAVRYLNTCAFVTRMQPRRYSGVTPDPIKSPTE